MAVPIGNICVPQGIFGNIWRNIWLSQGGVATALRSRMLLSILQCTGQGPTTKIYPIQSVECGIKTLF